jgi:hypothetical protein
MYTCHANENERKGVIMVDTNNLVSETVYMSVHDGTGAGTSSPAYTTSWF